MSVPIREVKQLSNVFVVFCILQSACIVLTALDVGLHLSKYCSDDSQWRELHDGKEIKWTEQGDKHKLCPEVPTIAPGFWTIPLVITCLVLIKIGSPTSLNPWVALITVAFVSCLVSGTATVGQAAIVHRSLNFTYPPVGTIIFCIFVINGLSLLGILGCSIGCMVISARLICSSTLTYHIENGQNDTLANLNQTNPEPQRKSTVKETLYAVPTPRSRSGSRMSGISNFSKISRNTLGTRRPKNEKNENRNRQQTIDRPSSHEFSLRELPPPPSNLVNSPSNDNIIQKRPTPPVFPNEENKNDEIDDKAVYEDLLLISQSNFIDMVEETPPPPVPKPIATPRGSIASRKSTRTSSSVPRPSKTSTASAGTLSRSIKQRANQIEMDLNRMMSTEPKEISREQKGSF